MSPVKEPQHFYSPHGKRMSREQYELLFNKASDDYKVVGEASVWYLFSEAAVDRILEYQPNAKFLVLLRNPMQMALSLHNHKKLRGHELAKDFKKAWQLKDKRSAGIPAEIYGLDSAEADLSHMNYKKACQTGTQLKRAYSKIPSQNILTILLDDLKEKPLEGYTKILNFLEVDYEGKTDFQKKNKARKRKSMIFHRILERTTVLKELLGIEKHSFGLLEWLWSLNTEETDYGDIDIDFKGELIGEFEEEISKIEDLLEVDLRKWRQL